MPPVSNVCEMVNDPEIDDEAAKVIRPEAPPAAVQVPPAFPVLSCVSDAVTVSVTVTPPVTNCHVPVQFPATENPPGPVGELPQAKSARASSSAGICRRTSATTVTSWFSSFTC